MTDLDEALDDPARLLGSSDAADRRLGVAIASTRLDDALVETLLGLVAGDPEPVVRAAAAEALGAAGRPSLAELLLTRIEREDDVRVIEAIAFALGELDTDVAVPFLIALAQAPGDTHAREAAVASLGAIGDERARQPLLELASAGPPQVRRRSVVALTAFDGSDVEDVIRAARDDRNPMVREVAEMILGRATHR